MLFKLVLTSQVDIRWSQQMIICHVKLTSWIQREMDGSEVRFQQTHESVTVVPLGNS